MPDLGKGGKIAFDPSQAFTGATDGADPTAASVDALFDTDVTIQGATSYTFTESGEEVDVTTLDDDVRNYLVAATEVTGTITMNREDGATANQDGFFLQDGGSSTWVGVGQTGVLIIRPHGTGSGKPQRSGVARITSIEESAEFSSAQTRVVNFRVIKEWAHTLQA